MPALRAVRLRNDTGRVLEGPKLNLPFGEAYATPLDPTPLAQGQTALTPPLTLVEPTQMLTVSAGIAGRVHQFRLLTSPDHLIEADLAMKWSDEVARYVATTTSKVWRTASGGLVDGPGGDLPCIGHTGMSCA